ncbi:ricin-type beta-trefoil lectin domain protein [Streptomyces platensis]|uniref:ricin-type beta-trefoil lectin domain protein n=1 Tax=Streptomyces platensis TaxID=58346 RepID=UPI002E25F4CF
MEEENKPWNILPNADGSFQIRNDKTRNCIDVADNNRLMQAQGCAASNSKQNWYAQPTGDGALRIRNVNNDKCMDVDESTVGFPVGLYDCGAGSANQKFSFEQPGGNSGGLYELAAEYALKQCSNNSSIIKSCDYEVTGDSKAWVGPLKIVAKREFNYSTSPAQRTLAWTDKTSQTDTVGASVTVNAEAGFNVGVVAAKVSTAIATHYSKTWTQESTVSDSQTITVNPHQYSWAIHGQLMKTVTGKWTFTNDVGDKWLGDGSATVPAKDETDGLESARAYCTSDSNDAPCVATRG